MEHQKQVFIDAYNYVCLWLVQTCNANWLFYITQRDSITDDTPAATAAQQSQAAVIAADSAVEKDGAVTERKHFPMNLNKTGYVIFSVS